MQTRGKKTKATSRDLQAAERRQQLLASAKELFAEQGYHATSIRSINQKIGMADGLIYHYFPRGKLEILQTIVMEGHEQRLSLIEEFSKTLTDEKPLGEILRMLSRRIYQFFTEDPQLMQIMFREQAMLESEQLGTISEKFQLRREWLARLLEQRAKRGEIREMNYMMAVTQFMSSNLIILFKDVLHISMVEQDHLAFMDEMIEHTLFLWKP